MNKYEKLIEYIINENEQKARELFHEIVVEKSRDIYESLMDEEQMAEMGGDSQQALADEIQSDHTGGIAEEEEDEDEFDIDGPIDGNGNDDGDLGGDFPADDQDPMGGDTDEPATKADIDELKDMFAEIQAQLGGDSDMDSGEGDFQADGEGEPGAGDEPSEMGQDEPEFGESIEEAEGSGSGSGSGMMEGENPFAKKGSGSGSGSGKGSDSGSGSGSGSGVKESKSVAQLMREYVDTIGQVYEQEPAKGPKGDMVGTGAKSEKQGEKNTKSVSLDHGPDFGGTSSNILNGKGNNESPDGKPVPKPNNEYSKGEGKFSNEKFQNAPGGSKKTSPVGQNWESENGAEGQTTSGKVPVYDKQVLKANTGKKI